MERNWISDQSFFRVDVDIGRHDCARRVLEFKLLHQAGEENEKLFLRQRLSETVPLSKTKRNDPLVVDELSVLVDEPCGVKHVRILEQLWVMHRMVQARHDSGSLWNGVLANLDFLKSVVRETQVDQAAYPETLQQDSVGVGRVFPVTEAGKSLMANNLKKIKRIFSLALNSYVNFDG